MPLPMPALSRSSAKWLWFEVLRAQARNVVATARKWQDVKRLSRSRGVDSLRITKNQALDLGR